MSTLNKSSISIFANRCPFCHQGEVFRYFLFIHQNCPNCGALFEKEEGYFFGPMIISYFLTLVLALPVFLYMMFGQNADRSSPMLVVGAFVVVVGPVLYRYSKLIWLHLESKFAGKMQAEQARAVQIAKEQNEKKKG